MIVIPTDQFFNHIDKIKDTTIIRRAEQTIEKLRSANSIQEVSNIKAIKGWLGYYRIGFGDYRIGFYYIEHEKKVELLAIAHRSKIYNIFP
jgi:mRNA-degrading endonuclease RelE of RelBE toxin-antitoxin system